MCHCFSRTATHLQVEAFKHGFAVRTALGDPGNQQRPFPEAGKIRAAARDLLNDTFVDYLRALTSDDTVLRDTAYGGRWVRGTPMPLASISVGGVGLGTVFVDAKPSC